MGDNQSLQQFLAGARDVVRSQQEQQQEQPGDEAQGPLAAAAAAKMPHSDDGSHSTLSAIERRRKVRTAADALCLNGMFFFMLTFDT